MLRPEEGKVHIVVMYMVTNVCAVILGSAAISIIRQGSDWMTIHFLSQLFKRHCNDLLANQLHMLELPL